MKILLRGTSPPGDSHQHITIFVNGACAGELCMTPMEAASFHQIVASGVGKGIDSFVSDGNWIDPFEALTKRDWP